MRSGFKYNWIEHEVRLRRTKTTIRAYVRMLLSGKVDYNILGKLYRPTHERPDLSVKRLLKQELVQNMVDAELQKVLEDKGINSSYVLDKLKKAIDISEAKENPVALMKCVENMQELLGMKGKAVKTTDQIEMSNVHLLADSADKAIKERESIKLSRTIEGKE